jgi:signal transduction histidine kinase
MGKAGTDRPVYFLVEDSRGHRWMGTDDGVLRWDGTALKHWTIEDGLGGRETNRAAGVVDSRGRLWIGTDAGVSIYRPEFDDQGPAPQVELTTVFAGGRDHELTRPLRLGHRDNDLLFRFRALSFRDEKRLRFQSWLEGFEADRLPAYAAPRQELRYTNLPPGEYRFHLRAASAEGVWSEPISSAVIHIAEPFWRRPWFVLSLSLLGALTLFGAQRSMAQWRYAGRLEKEVVQRTADLEAANRELANLTREKAEFLAIAAHDLRVPLVNLRGFAAEIGGSLTDLKRALQPAWEALPAENRRQVEALLEEEVPEELTFIDSSAERMDRLVTAILQLSRLEHRELHLERVDMAALVAGLLESLAYRLEQHPATVQVGPLPEVTADSMAMEQILQNLLGNAVGYLRPDTPGRIEIRGRREGNEAIFEVADNGRGIAEADREKVFQIFGRAGRSETKGEGMGLAYVRTLLRRHGGRVWFESRFGEGTVFRFAVPVSPEVSL